MKIFIYVFSFCCIAQFSYAQHVQWAIEYKPNNYYLNIDKKLGIDKTGNIYLEGSMYLADSNLNHGSSMPYLAKFSHNGQEIWCDSIINRMGFQKIKVDKDGNSFIIGSFMDSIKLGSLILTDTVSYTTVFYAKINSNGIFQWAYKLPHRVFTSDIQLLPSGEFYLVGSTFMIGAKLGNDSIAPSTGFIAKYDSTGLCIKATKISNSYTHFIFQLDRVGNFYIAGNFSGTIALGHGSNIIYASSNTWTSALIAKFDSSLNVQWVKVGYTYGMYEPVCGLGIDSIGNVYCAGTLGSYISFEGHTVSTGGNNMFLVKYDPAGNYQWMKYSFSTGINDCFGLMVDEAGNSYVTGGLGAHTTYFDSYMVNNKYSPYLIKYDSNGNLLLGMNTSFLPMGTYGEGKALCKDVTGNLLISGNFGEYKERSFVAKISENATSIEINQNENNSFLTIYPNPTAGIFQINYSSIEKGNLQLNVTNSKGQLISTESISHFDGEFKKAIDLSKQAKGVYFIEVINNKKKEVKKIMLD